MILKYEFQLWRVTVTVSGYKQYNMKPKKKNKKKIYVHIYYE